MTIPRRAFWRNCCANDGHQVQLPSDIGMMGKPDAVHLTRAIRDDYVCVTKNYDRQENDPTRDLTPKGIVTAIRKLEAAGVPIVNEYIVLNHWR
jgi:hypothetical protein